eukprot:813899-Prymnesium_polylepis.1
MVLPVVIVRCLVKLDRASHASELYPHEQRLEQLATGNRCSVPHLDQIMKCMCEGEHSIVGVPVVRHRPVLDCTNRLAVSIHFPQRCSLVIGRRVAAQSISGNRRQLGGPRMIAIEDSPAACIR